MRAEDVEDLEFRKEISRLLSKCREDAAYKLRVRADYNLIYVRTHVVKAYFRVAPGHAIPTKKRRKRRGR